MNAIERCRRGAGVPVSLPHAVQDLLDRSHRLGADPRTTNYAGGNTSAKTSLQDPVTGESREVMFVKGSGGDLGTLRADGLAVLDVARLRALTSRYRGVEHEDEMVGLLDHCAWVTDDPGLGGAAPSIDTQMHGLLPCAHVDHLHPDSIISLATAADGEVLTKECFGPAVGWVNWRRPGFALALEIEALRADNPGLKGVILGGHGMTAWGDTSAECEETSHWMVRRAAEFLIAQGRPDPFGPVVAGHEALPQDQRRQRAAALLPIVRGLVSTDRREVGHFTDSDVVLDFLSRAEMPRLAFLGTSCPDHFLRTKVRPLVLDLPADAPLDDVVTRLRELHAAYRADYAAYYERYRVADSPAMRGADPSIVLVPGVGMFSFGADKQTARVAGEFYVNAINVMRGAESVSSYSPIPESEKFAIEYWLLEEAKLQRRPKPKPLATRIALVTGGGSGIGRAIAHRLAAEGACVVVTDRDAAAANEVADEIGGADIAASLPCDVRDEAAIAAMTAEAVLTFGGLDLVVNNAGLSLSKPLVETTVDDWDLQHDVMARGSFLVARESARILIDQALGGDIIYIVSKNAVVAGPENIAYSAAKADQAHQVRLLAAELGPHGVRVNGINPDGVVRGSGIFANGWGAQRAAVYGVPEEELGAFYAGRTLLKREVLPDHIAAAVAALTTGDLPLTTGLLIPVDGGVPAAFLR
jgi:rhamnulose-1-phosphate aldolase/alcohol dehydrogenase